MSTCLRRSRPGSLEAEASPAVHDQGQHDQQLLATNVREASHNMHPGPARSMGGHCHQAASLFKAGMVLCRPSTSAMLRALELLLALGALGAEGALTPLGRHMVRLPVEPVFAKVRPRPAGPLPCTTISHNPARQSFSGPWGCHPEQCGRCSLQWLQAGPLAECTHRGRPDGARLPRRSCLLGHSWAAARKP